MSSEPPLRAADDPNAPASLRQALQLAGEELPGAAQLARLNARIEAVLAAGVPAGAPDLKVAGKGSAPLTRTLSGKWLIGLGVVGGLVVFAAGQRLRSTTPAAAPSASQSIAPPAAPAAGPASSAKPGPAPVGEGDPLTETTRPATEPADPSSQTPLASTPAQSRPSPATSSSATALTEEQLLRQAQQALRSDPGRALQLSQRHGREFPRGVLGQEREVIAIEALSALGRSAEARRRAERFERNFPNSAHRNKVRALVGSAKQ